VSEPRLAELPGATLLNDGAFWRLFEHRPLHLLWVERTARPFSTAEETIDSARVVLGNIRVEHLSFGLVVDVRRSVLPNNAAVQPALRTMRQQLAARVRRIVLLVSTVEASMTLRDVVLQDKMQVAVTHDPTEARHRAMGG
jgi:hypothetical protein